MNPICEGNICVIGEIDEIVKSEPIKYPIFNMIGDRVHHKVFDGWITWKE